MKLRTCRLLLSIQKPYDFRIRKRNLKFPMTSEEAIDFETGYVLVEYCRVFKSLTIFEFENVNKISHDVGRGDRF